MKTTLAILMLAAGIAYGSDWSYPEWGDDSRVCFVAGKGYVVHYHYNKMVASIPRNDSPHYDATITVMEMTTNGEAQVGEPFAGQYVPGGCFEDKPESLVGSALMRRFLKDTATATSTNSGTTNFIPYVPPMPCGTNEFRVSVPEYKVRKLAESGEVCKLYGHWWERIPHATLEYRPDGDYPEHRKCRLCGKTETKTEVWK